MYPKREPLLRMTGYSQRMFSRRQFEHAGRSDEHLIFFLRHAMQATTSFFLSLASAALLAAALFLAAAAAAAAEAAVATPPGARGSFLALRLLPASGGVGLAAIIEGALDGVVAVVVVFPEDGMGIDEEGGDDEGWLTMLGNCWCWGCGSRCCLMSPSKARGVEFADETVGEDGGWRAGWPLGVESLATVGVPLGTFSDI